MVEDNIDNDDDDTSSSSIDYDDDDDDDDNIGNGLRCASRSSSSSNSNSKFCFTIIPQVFDGYETRFGVGVQPSELYQPTGMVLPKLPMYHPYHPLNNNSLIHKEDILQVPLAMIISSSAPNNNDKDAEDCDHQPPLLVPPRKLLDLIAKRRSSSSRRRNNNIIIGNNNGNHGSSPDSYFIIVQTLPYRPDTQVICRYQYALFPNAKSQMKGHESLWAQSIIYNHYCNTNTNNTNTTNTNTNNTSSNNNNNINNDNELEVRCCFPVTSIKIYESDTEMDISPTILCGNTMAVDTVDNLCGKAIWSYVVGSSGSCSGSSGPVVVDVDEDGFLLQQHVSHSYIGLTYFLPNIDGNNTSYTNFIREIQDKSPSDIIKWLPSLIENNNNSSSSAAAATVLASSTTIIDEVHEKLCNLTV